MKIKFIAPSFFFLWLLIAGCSKKHQPQTTETTVTEEKTAALAAEKKKLVKKAIGLPKVITVDDRAAKKSVDGRLYYDLEGHRYWRNYDDGKYYLYSKKMYNDPAFKPH